MQLKVGKYYKTRDGRKVGPMRYDDTWGGYVCENTGMVFGPNGYHGDSHDLITNCIANIPSNDLIVEWTATPTAPTLSPETIDHIAIDSLKFHVADNDMEPLQKEAFRIVLRYYGVTL